MLKRWNLKKQRWDYESKSWEQAENCSLFFKKEEAEIALLAVASFFIRRSLQTAAGFPHGIQNPWALWSRWWPWLGARRGSGWMGTSLSLDRICPADRKHSKLRKRKIAMGLPSSIIVSIHPSSTNNNNHAIWPFSFLSSALITLLDNGYKVLVVKLIYPQLYTIIMKDHKIAVLYCK